MDTQSQPPWYVAGLAFECVRCSRCCSGPEEGYVWVTEAEIADIANFLRITPQEMRNRHVRAVAGRYTLIEQVPSNDCIFLTPTPDGGKCCSVYSVRPAQCRTWPFWASNLRSCHAWCQAASRCGGINRGRQFSIEEILQRSRTPRV